MPFLADDEAALPLLEPAAPLFEAEVDPRLFEEDAPAFPAADPADEPPFAEVEGAAFFAEAPADRDEPEVADFAAAPVDRLEPRAAVVDLEPEAVPLAA